MFDIVKDLKTLKKDDYIETLGLYYKVFEVKKKGLLLSNPFSKGLKPDGKWFCLFKFKFEKSPHPLWHIIRGKSKEARKIEGR